MQHLDILSDLVAFRSITPEGANITAYITELLTKHGFTCDVTTFGEGSESTTNLFAYRGVDSGPHICFAGHTDVVPPGDESLWQQPPFKLKVECGLAYGRGVIDMKGSIAVALAAAIQLSDEYYENGMVSFLLTSDEEGDGTYGTKMLLEHIQGKYRDIDLCILGEPTAANKMGDTASIGRRGSANFILKITGKQGHVAFPEESNNPCHATLKALSALGAVKFTEDDRYTAKTNLEITSIDVGNEVCNIIPESATARFNVRFCSNYSLSQLVNLVDETIKNNLAEGCSYNLQHSCVSLPFMQEENPILQSFLEVANRVSGVKPELKSNGGTSDARFIYKQAMSVEYGLPSHYAHKIDEQVKISDLQILHNVYYQFLLKCLTK